MRHIRNPGRGQTQGHTPALWRGRMPDSLMKTNSAANLVLEFRTGGIIPLDFLGHTVKVRVIPAAPNGQPVTAPALRFGTTRLRLPDAPGLLLAHHPAANGGTNISRRVKRKLARTYAGQTTESHNHHRFQKKVLRPGRAAHPETPCRISGGTEPPAAACPECPVLPVHPGKRPGHDCRPGPRHPWPQTHPRLAAPGSHASVHENRFVAPYTQGQNG